jgi:hypothetical protein
VLAAPAALPYPGKPWRNALGEVATSEITLTSLECFDPQITLLTMGWPIGRALRVEADGRQYIRDPGNAHRDSTLAPFDGNTVLPPDARPTGLHNGDVELFGSPSTSDSRIYVRRGAVIEQWPRVFPMIACV